MASEITGRPKLRSSVSLDENSDNKINQEERNNELKDSANEQTKNENEAEVKNNEAATSQKTMLGRWSKTCFIVFAIVLAIAFPKIKDSFDRYFGKNSIPDIAPFLKETAEEEKLSDEVWNLDSTFREQNEDIWDMFSSGIKRVLKEKPNKPSVFLMIYDNDSTGKTAECIALDVSKIATTYLKRKLQQPVIINSNDLTSFIDNPGVMLSHYNSSIREKGALIVHDLHAVPPNIAEMFHFICDANQPLVERAVIFFTLRVEEQIPDVRYKVTKVVHDRLIKLWEKSIEENKLHPLITRITPNIMEIKKDVTNC